MARKNKEAKEIKMSREELIETIEKSETRVVINADMLKTILQTPLADEIFIKISENEGVVAYMMNRQKTALLRAILPPKNRNVLSIKANTDKIVCFDKDKVANFITALSPKNDDIISIYLIKDDKYMVIDHERRIFKLIQTLDSQPESYPESLVYALTEKMKWYSIGEITSREMLNTISALSTLSKEDTTNATFSYSKKDRSFHVSAESFGGKDSLDITLSQFLNHNESYAVVEENEKDVEKNNNNKDNVIVDGADVRLSIDLLKRASNSFKITDMTEIYLKTDSVLMLISYDIVKTQGQEQEMDSIRDENSIEILSLIAPMFDD